LEVSVIASIPIPDTLKAKAVGYAEGQLQADRVFDYWTNYKCVHSYVNSKKATFSSETSNLY
jgi:hypothetical protein